MSNDIRHNLILMAESVKAKISYELNVQIDSAEFFKLNFQNQIIENKKLCKVIFKLGNNEL